MTSSPTPQRKKNPPSQRADHQHPRRHASTLPPRSWPAQRRRHCADADSSTAPVCSAEDRARWRCATIDNASHPHRLCPTAAREKRHDDGETGTREAGKPPLPLAQPTHGRAELADLDADAPHGQDGFVRARFGGTRVLRCSSLLQSAVGNAPRRRSSLGLSQLDLCRRE
jgi:hypothetical protein